MLACLLQQLVLAYLPLLCLLCKAKAQAWHRAKSIQRKECLSASHKVSFCQPSYTASDCISSRWNILPSCTKVNNGPIGINYQLLSMNEEVQQVSAPLDVSSIDTRNWII